MEHKLKELKFYESVLSSQSQPVGVEDGVSDLKFTEELPIFQTEQQNYDLLQSQMSVSVSRISKISSNTSGEKDLIDKLSHCEWDTQELVSDSLTQKISHSGELNDVIEGKLKVAKNQRLWQTSVFYYYEIVIILAMIVAAKYFINL